MVKCKHIDQQHCHHCCNPAVSTSILFWHVVICCLLLHFSNQLTICHKFCLTDLTFLTYIYHGRSCSRQLSLQPDIFPPLKCSRVPPLHTQNKHAIIKCSVRNVVIISALFIVLMRAVWCLVD
ncbi:hypothetical protein CDAR_40161 [Caerostris darwini]|uniref:Uncharacterized protein n=1 Tax=Caerostris darwini TaxID=1538125 RepID=A0AAV4RCX5_9ARAC|nr:hypothetical protein CDAR_40161 [Caerostris darwini]